MAQQVVAMILVATTVLALVGHIKLTDFVMLLLLAYPLFLILKMQ